MNELNGQIAIDELNFLPKRLVSIAKQESFEINNYRYKELVIVVNIISKIIDYIVYVDNDIILSTDNLIKAIHCYNEAK